MRSLHRRVLFGVFAAILAGALTGGAVLSGITHAAPRHGTISSAPRASAGSPPGCGGSWNVVSSPDPITNPDDVLLSAAAISPSDSWAVGASAPASTIYGDSTLALHWNGSAWSIVPTPNPTKPSDDVLKGVAALASNNVWAVGYANYEDASATLVEHWNGTSWTIIPSPSNQLDQLNAVAAVSPTDIWAVGADATSTLAEHWNGTQWSMVATPTQSAGSYSYLTGIVALASNNVWAVGAVNGLVKGAPYYYSTLIEHWNGSTWTTVTRPTAGTAGSHLTGITALSANNIWAVGDTYYEDQGGQNIPQSLTEHWNGSAWSIVPTPALTGAYNSLSSVAAVSSSNIWAVGYTRPGNLHRTLIEHWNGTSWSAAISPNPSTSIIDDLYGVAVSPFGRYVVAVGSFGYPSGTTMAYQTLVEQQGRTLFQGGATGSARRSGPGGAVACP